MLRRLVTVPGLVLIGVLVLALLPVWLPLGALVDLLRRRWRFPTVRLLSFALVWAWVEMIGVKVTIVLWLVGRGKNVRAHYALQRWWAARLLGALRVLCGIEVTADNVEALRPGPVLLFARHASLADSLVSCYVVACLAGMNPRYVLKRELLVDPCLDIVGHRLPNHFLDREARDSTPELAALASLVSEMGDDSVGIIFPEGTRANPVKRTKALEKIAASDPERGRRLAGMRHLLPPRPSGAAAMARGNTQADIVLAWHTGFEGLDTFGGIYGAIARGVPPVHFAFQRHTRSSVPVVGEHSNGDFTRWLDEQWMAIDEIIDHEVTSRAVQGSEKGRANV